MLWCSLYVSGGILVGMIEKSLKYKNIGYSYGGTMQ